MQEVSLGITGTGVRKWLKEGKEAKTDCIYEHTTAVGNCSWIPLGMSGKWYGSHLKSFCTQGANKQGCLSANSHLQWLRVAPKHTDYIPQPITHKHTCPPICSSGLSCTCAEHVHVARESPQVESHRCWQQEMSLRCSVCSKVNQSPPGSGRRPHWPVQRLKALSAFCDSSSLALRHC